MSSPNPKPVGQPLAITQAGETLWLLPERALWWPRLCTLFVADLHLGKAATYRALGQPVPAGTTDENLARLTGLLAAYPATQLVFLGDFLHAAQARTPSVLQALTLWREAHSGVNCTLVRGNHDSRAGDPPAVLGIAVVNEPWPVAGAKTFLACHHPQSQPGHTVLAGHLHPVLSLRGPGRDRLRLPCFSVEQGQIVLPAFGEFTGGWRVDAAPGRQLYPAGGGAVWSLSASHAGPTGLR